MAAYAEDEDDDEEGETGSDGDPAAAVATPSSSRTESEDPPSLLPRPRRRKKKLVGLARLLSDGSFAAHLSDVVVDPRFRHRGVGRALVGAAVKEALLRRGPRGDAASSVVSWARPGRPRLFLQRCGFRVSVAYRVLRYEGDLMN